MLRKRAIRSKESTADEEMDTLEALNADVRNRRNAPNSIRRRMEASLEAKAKRKRSREVPASSALGGALSKPRA